MASEIAMKVAETYGVEAFREVESIEYTFNVARGQDTFSRSWRWYPQEDAWAFLSDTPAVELARDTFDTATAPQRLLRLDQAFINDHFWLFVPYHLAWDQNVEFALVADTVTPIAGVPADMLRLTYTDGGYTPGDVYELYLDEERLLLEWTFLKGGSRENPLHTTWEEPLEGEGFVLETARENPDQGFRLWFSGIRYRLRGNEEWQELD